MIRCTVCDWTTGDASKGTTRFFAVAHVATRHEEVYNDICGVTLKEYLEGLHPFEYTAYEIAKNSGLI